MATTYTPVATNTQAPASPSDPDNVPLESLPSDGDALNAASVAQAFKVLGDYIAWLKAPIGVASAWVQALRNYRNPLGNRVSGIDHFGVPGGRLITITEDWLDAAAVQISTKTNGHWFGKWNYGVFNTSGIGHIYANGPTGNLANSPWGPVCGVDFNGLTAGSGATVVESAKPWFYMSDDLLEYECDISLTGPALLSDTTIGVGLGDGTLVSSSSVASMDTTGATPVGAWIYRPASQGFWYVRTVAPGGGPSPATITAVVATVNSPLRWKVVIAGTAASDDGTARVLHYINGALVANHAVNMNGASLFPFQRIQGDQPDVSVLEVGPVRAALKLALGDSPI